MKGLFADLTEANQTLLKDALQRYKNEVTAKKKGAKQESYKIDKLMCHIISNYSSARYDILSRLKFLSSCGDARNTSKKIRIRLNSDS